MNRILTSTSFGTYFVFFEVLLFKSNKNESFFVSPKPACLRYLAGFTRLRTWALDEIVDRED